MTCRVCRGSTWSSWQWDIYHQLVPQVQLDQGIAPGVVSFMNEWQQYETGGQPQPDFNPFAVANSGGGTADFNSSGVMNFRTARDGARETANRIRQYPGIYAIFRDSNVEASHIAAAIPDLRRWGSKTFADKLASNSGPVQPRESAGAADWTSIDLSSLGINPLDWLSVLGGFFKFFLWLLQPKHWLQLLEIMAGTVLVGLGLWQLAKAAQGGSTTGAAASVARAGTKATKAAPAPVRAVAKAADSAPRRPSRATSRSIERVRQEHMRRQ